MFAVALVRTGSFQRLKKLINITVVCGFLFISGISILAPNVAKGLYARVASITKTKTESSAQYRNLELDAQKKHSLMHDSTLGYLFGHGDFTWSYWALDQLGEHYGQDAIANAKKGNVLVHAGFYMSVTLLHDNGIVGFILYAAFFLWFVYFYWRRCGQLQDFDHRMLMSASFLPIVVMLGCFQLSYDPITPFLWVLMGLHLALGYHLKQVEDGKQQVRFKRIY